jgi:hypothetical protein
MKQAVLIICTACFVGFFGTKCIHAESESLVPVYQLLLNNAFAPSNFQAVLLPGDKIRLTWKDNARDESGFKLLVTLRLYNGNVKRKEFAFDPDTIQFDLDLQANDLMYMLPSSQYIFDLHAYDNTRSEGPDPLEFKVPGDLPVPSAPISVAADPVQKSSSQMMLSWTDTSSNEQGFRIYRSPADSNSFVEIGQVKANVTSFMDSNLHPCTGYDYRVYAFNAEGFYDGYGQTTGQTAPAPPLNPQASQGTVLYQVYLDWSDPSLCAGGYNIYHLNTAGDTWVKLNDTPTPTLKADVFNVPPGIQQYFKLSSVDVSGNEGDMGEYVMGWAAAPTPTNNWASRGTDNDDIWLHWDAVQVTWSNWPPTHQNLYADGYVVTEATNINGPYTEHSPFVWDTHNSNPLLYQVTDAVPGQHYFFKVAAIYQDRQDWDGDGDTDEYVQGDWSAPMEGWRGTSGSAPPVYLPAPASITATDGTYPFRINVSWSGVGGAASYEVYRGSSPWGPWQHIRNIIGTAFDNTTTDAQYPIITNTGYYYFVCPVDNSGIRGHCSPYDGGFAASHILQR